MVGPVTNEDSSINPNIENIKQQQNYRLQLLAQAIEKVESESSQKKPHTALTSNSPKKTQKISIDPLLMTSTQQQQPQHQQPEELMMKLFAPQHLAAVMAAAAQLQVHQQQKPEPISPPSTSSASSTSESPIDFSSRRSTDDNTECSAPSSPLSNQQLLSTMLQNIQSTSSTFPLLLTNKNGKPTRPFKAYPRDPLMLPLGFCTTTAEQTSILAEVASRTTTSRKRLAQTQERLKQRLQQQQQQQQQPLPQQPQKPQQPQSIQQQPYFISSSGTQILQPPKKRHRAMDTDVNNEDNKPIENPNTNASPPLPLSPSPSTKATSINNNNSDEQASMAKDDAYWERRRKNNEAAKRSRDARRAKEDEIAIRAAILEQENIKLRLEVSQLKQETAKLRCMVYATS